jgi:hypothetical protein
MGNVTAEPGAGNAWWIKHDFYHKSLQFLGKMLHSNCCSCANHPFLGHWFGAIQPMGLWTECVDSRDPLITARCGHCILQPIWKWQSMTQDTTRSITCIQISHHGHKWDII